MQVVNLWEPRTANLEKPLVILSQTGVTYHGGSDVDVFGTPYIGGLGDLFGCSMEHTLRPECRIGFCSQRVNVDGCGCCSFDGDEDNGRLLSPFHIWIQSSLVQGGKPTSGGIALLWRENYPGVEVEATQILMPNLLTFQLVTGDEQYYCMGVYIPPNDIMGVEDL